MKICTLCKGTGSLFSVFNKKFEWWDCPAKCNNGCRGLVFYTDISISSKQQKIVHKGVLETEKLRSSK